MPRDISGNYTLPAGNPVVDGTIIDVTWANPTMSDIALQLNGVLTRDGLLGPLAPVRFVDGTAAFPSITFSAQTTLGLYRSATDVISFSSSANQAHSFSATQIRTGFGVNGYIVNVAGDATHTGFIEFRSSAGNRQGYIGFSDTNTTPGTIPYVAALHAFEGVATVTVPAGVAPLRAVNGARTLVLGGGDGSTFQVVGNSEAFPIMLYTNNLERVRLQANGQVSIGGFATAQDFRVQFSGSGEHYSRFSMGSQDLYVGQSGGTVMGIASGALGVLGQDAALPFGMVTFNAQHLLLGTNNAERFRIDGTTGNIATTGDITAAGNITANSDERYKSGWALGPTVEDFANLRAGTFDRDGRRWAGASAQSLREFLPEAVHEADDGMLSIAYGNAALVGVAALARRLLALEEKALQ